MPELTFYRQVRADGGERTGIDLDGRSLMEYYEPETAEFDPALLWFVDVRCEGEQFADDPQGARDWFLKNREFFVGQLARIADEELDAGFDAEYRPFQRELVGAPDGVRARIVISAVRRLQAVEIAQAVRQMAENWTAFLDRLVPLSVV